MKKLLCPAIFLLGLFSIATANSAVELTIPPISVVRQRSLTEGMSIRLQEDPPNSGSYTLAYTIRSHGEDLRSERKLSRPTAAEVSKILTAGTPPYASWTGDLQCPRKSSWRVNVGGKKMEVCREESQISVLQHFLSVVAALSTQGY